jgi:transcriptional regulator with XRE-family HTH domain
MTQPTFAGRFALRLRAARLDAGLSQAELARRIGRSKQLTNAWESGRSAMLARDLIRVAAVLGCSADRLLGLEPLIPSMPPSAYAPHSDDREDAAIEFPADLARSPRTAQDSNG